nr:uncharacterized protein LOC104093695 [Nicotiana tomentosiformis]
MTKRLGICAITPDTLDWTCKVQVVDIRRPGESTERKIKYLNMIFQDEHMCLQLLSSASQQDMLQVCGKDCRNSLSLIPGKQTFTFTIWEEAIIEDEGKKLLTQFQEYPIIFARRIGVSKYNGTSLTTRFNTTIQINPPYLQCLQLRKWIIENKEMLASFILKSTSASRSLIFVPVDEEIVPIANVQSQQDASIIFIYIFHNLI